MSIGVDRVHFRYSFIVVMLLIQSCSAPLVESPTPSVATAFVRSIGSSRALTHLQ